MIINGANNLVVSGTLTFGSTAANTRKTQQILQTKPLSEHGMYRIGVRNSGTTSALTVIVKERMSFATSGTYAELTRFSVGTSGASTPGNSGRVILLQGWLMGAPTSTGTAGRIDVLNDTAIGTGKGFNVRFDVRRV